MKILDKPIVPSTAHAQQQPERLLQLGELTTTPTLTMEAVSMPFELH
jgi:hypothetical protein